MRLLYHQLSRSVSAFGNSIPDTLHRPNDRPAPFEIYGLTSEIMRDPDYVAVILGSARRFRTPANRAHWDALIRDIETRIREHFSAEDVVYLAERSANIAAARASGLPVPESTISVLPHTIQELAPLTQGRAAQPPRVPI